MMDLAIRALQDQDMSAEDTGSVNIRDSSSLPKIELKKKAKSSDPGWKYAYWPDENDKNKVKCELCGLITNGGIKRQKEHLIGGFSDVKKCPKSTKEIAEEMLSWLNKHKKRKWSSFPSVFENVTTQSNEVAAMEKSRTESCLSRRQGSISPKKYSKGPMDKFLRMGSEDFVNARRSGENVHGSLESKFKKEEKLKLDEAIATWFYENGVPFTAAKSRSFQIMFELAGRIGPGYKPPSHHMLRTSLLKKMVEKTREMHVECMQHWKVYGCTIICDEWTDKRGRKLINFLVHCPKGTYFMESVDVSDQREDAQVFYELLDKVVEKVGEEHVVQVVTDNASHNIAAGRMLMEKRKKLFWTPCAAYCLYLMLEDIGKLKDYVDTISKAQKLTSYIYNHARLLEYMKRETKGRELVRFGVTRFATTFLTLERLHNENIKRALRRLFTSRFWCNSAWANTNMGKNVASIVFQVKFWHVVEEILRASEPILQVLRLIAGYEKPAVGYICAAIEHAKKQIIENFGSKEAKYQPILEIVNQHWKDQMNHPLHEAGFFLNPKFYFDARQKDACAIWKFQRSFLSCLDKMEPDGDLQDKISDQMMLYMNERGMFGRPMAVRARDRMLPTDWWMLYGGETPELKMFALRILGLCCSSSGELNQRIFEFIHTKKRNRLEHKRLRDVVYVQCNQFLRERFNERMNHLNKYDPLRLQDLDWESAWLTEDDDDLAHEGDDLSWTAIRGKAPSMASTLSSDSVGNDDEEEEECLNEEVTDDDDGGEWELNAEDDEDGGDEVESDMGLENAIFGFKI